MPFFVHDKMKKTLIIIGIAVLLGGIGTYYYQNFMLAKDFEFQPVGFTELKTTGTTITFVATFLLRNVSNLQAEIKDLDITALVNGVKVGGLKSPGPTVIPPDGNTKISMQISIEKKTLSTNLLDMVKTFVNTNNIPVDFIGVVGFKSIFGYISLPIKHSTTGRDLYELWKTYYKTPQK